MFPKKLNLPVLGKSTKSQTHIQSTGKTIVS